MDSGILLPHCHWR